MTLDEDSKCTLPTPGLACCNILACADWVIRDPVVVMVLSLGFIASVFLLQYVPVMRLTNELVSLRSSRRNGLVNVIHHNVFYEN